MEPTGTGRPIAGIGGRRGPARRRARGFQAERAQELSAVGGQSETSLRHLASEYPYDDYKPETASLRGNVDEVRSALHAELEARLDLAGIEILETRLTHLDLMIVLSGDHSPMPVMNTGSLYT